MLVCGTGTEVGKTWVACRLADDLRRRGRTVAARKPAQSHDPTDPAPTDAQRLGAATGEDPEVVCPPGWTYPVAMAPPMAAAVLGRPTFSVKDLADGVVWSAPVDIGLIETAGGVRSPQADDGDCIDLGVVLAPDLAVLVADAGLGTINAVRAVAPALLDHWPLVVILNRYEDVELHRRNRDWLQGREGLVVVSDVDGLADAVESSVVSPPVHAHGSAPPSGTG